MKKRRDIQKACARAIGSPEGSTERGTGSKPCEVCEGSGKGPGVDLSAESELAVARQYGYQWEGYRWEGYRCRVRGFVGAK